MTSQDKESEASKSSSITWRVWLAIFLLSAIFMPLSIYVELSVPAGIGWVPVILLTWVLLGRFFGKPVTKEEAFLIRFGAMSALGNFLLGNIFLGFIKNGYIAYSAAFKTAGIAAPWWYSLPEGHPALLEKTFFNTAWLPLIAVSLLSFLLNVIGTIALSFITYELYVNVEKLPFPYAQVAAVEVISLTGTERRRTSIFYIFMMLGFVLGMILYGLPIITLALFGRAMAIGHQLYWSLIDLTPYFETSLPGAAYSISLDLSSIMIGWIIPDHILISMIVGNITIWIIGGHLAYITPSPLFEMWRSAWFPGADTPWLYAMGSITLWINVFIGMSVAAGVLFFLFRWRDLKNSFTGISKHLGGKGARKMLSLYALTVLLSFLLFIYLVPSFPVIYTIPLFLWEFLMIFVQTWATGAGTWLPSLPYARNFTILLSGYRGSDVWFAWPQTVGGAAVNVTSIWKAGSICGVKIRDIILVMLIAYIPFLLFALSYTEMFWRIAPIPSAFYPMTMINWPMEAVQTALWPSIAKGGTIPPMFQPSLMIQSFAVSGIVISALALLKLPLTAFLGFLAGSQSFPSLALSLSIAIITKHIFSRTYSGTWEEDKVTIPAGFGMGTSLAIAISVGALIIIRTLQVT